MELALSGTSREVRMKELYPPGGRKKTQQPRFIQIIHLA
jgi:hypothetical protein